MAGKIDQPSFGRGSQATVAGMIAAAGAFVISWVQYGMTPETTTLGVTCGGIIIAFFAGRSHQARGLIDQAVEAYEGNVVAGSPTDQDETVDPDPVQDPSVAVVPLTPVATTDAPIPPTPPVA